MEPSLTYRALRDLLNAMPSEKLDDPVTVFVRDSAEYYPVTKLTVAPESDVLEGGHYYIVA